MSGEDRFYQLQLSNRPAMWGDIGSNVRIQGLVVGGSGGQAILMLPGIVFTAEIGHVLTDREWNEFIRRSDDPEILIGNSKIFQRKLRYEISGAVQQKVWAADGFRCMYCGAQMGKSKLTVDHFVPLELQGRNDDSNYLTSCASCNKRKGNMDPEQWCKKVGANFYDLTEYLRVRKLS